MAIMAEDHRFSVDVSSVSFALDYERTAPGHLPDIGFIALPNLFSGQIDARQKAFYNLRQHEKDIRDTKAEKSTGMWVLTGAPEELTTRERSMREPGMVDCYNCLAAFTGIRSCGNVGPWDGLAASVNYLNCSNDVPSSFQGCSGGGVWNVKLHRGTDGSIHVGKYLLCGVAYYQTPVENQMREIHCHGPNGMLAFLEQQLEA